MLRGPQTPGELKQRTDRLYGFSGWGEVEETLEVVLGELGREAELLTVIEGRLEIEVKGLRVVVSPGDEAFIPKGASHSVFNVHDGTTVWLYGYD